MSFTASVYRILIASPSDVHEERDCARAMLHEWNALNSATTGIVMLPIMWETHAAPQMGDHPQVILNEQIVSYSDGLIGFFWTRIGTNTGRAESGTVEEIDQITAAGKPTMLYFSTKPVVPQNLDSTQFDGVQLFRKKCESLGLIDTYDSVTSLKEKLSRHLTHLAKRFGGSPNEIRQVVPPGTGQYQGMVYQMVSQNQAGWDFPRAHALMDKPPAK